MDDRNRHAVKRGHDVVVVRAGHNQDATTADGQSSLDRTGDQGCAVQPQELLGLPQAGRRPCSEDDAHKSGGRRFCARSPHAVRISAHGRYSEPEFRCQSVFSAIVYAVYRMSEEAARG